MPTILGTGAHRYEVVDNWAKLPPGREFNADVAAVGVDKQDRVYAFNRGKHPMVVLDRAGNFLRSWGEPGTDPGQFNIPHNICCDADGWVYVADRENHRVQVFDGSGKFETQWINMHRPSGLFMEHGGQGRFFVGEIGGGMGVNYDMPNIGPRVSIYSHKGELLARLGQRPAGLEPGQFISPHGLAVDSHGDIYVGEVSYTNWRNRYKEQPHPPGLRSLQKLVKVG